MLKMSSEQSRQNSCSQRSLHATGEMEYKIIEVKIIYGDGCYRVENRNGFRDRVTR